MTQEPNEPKKVELKSNRIITAQIIRDLAEVLDIVLKTTTIDNLSYFRLAQGLTKDPRFAHINPGTLRNTFDKIFPKNKLKAKKTPKEIAKEFLDTNPKYLIPEKLAKATELYKPGISIKKLADAVGLEPQTVREYLNRANVPKLTAAQKGINQKLKRGQPEKEKYRYFAYPKVLLVAEALQRNNLDKEKTVNELRGRFKETQIRDLLQVVFPAYLLEKGLDYCVNKYKEWQDTKPFSDEKRLNDEQKARIEILKIIKSELNKDETINHKKIFLYIVFELLIGNEISIIAKKYNLNEITVRGIKNRLQTYFLDYEARTKISLEPLLRRTKFFSVSAVNVKIRDFNRLKKLRAKIRTSMQRELRKKITFSPSLYRSLARRK